MEKKFLNYSLKILFVLLVLNLTILSQQSPFIPKPDDKENEAEFEKSDGEYAQKRAEFRYKMRANENGIIPFGSLLRAKRMTDELRALPNQPLPMDAGIWNWEWIGPGNIGGRIRTILFHPTNPNTIWIGSVSGGIWRTDYGGSTWYPVDDFMANLAVTSMVIDPTNPSVMYAATGEGFNNLDAVQGAGIFKSYDGGVTWAQLACTNSDSFYYVNRLAHHPTISGLIYCVTARPSGGGEIRRTTDGGITWPMLTTTSNRATDVKIHPQFPNRIFVGTRAGLLSSHDSGTNWFLETNGAVNKLPQFVGRCEVGFGNGDTMYVSIQVNNSEIWRSIDSGTTWTRRSTSNNYLGGQGWYNNVLWISPFNSNFILLGGVGLGRSTDGGQTFTNMMSFHADQHAIVAHPNYDGVNNRYIYVGNDGGIGFAMDTTSVAGGWQELNNNLGITQFYGGGHIQAVR